MLSEADMKLISLQLPDYFEIIEQPMDFGTVRKKLDDGAYKNLEEVEVGSELYVPNLRTDISIFLSSFELFFGG